MSHGDAAHVQIGKQGLDIAQQGFFTGGRISDMTNRGPALQALDYALGIEVITHVAKTAVTVEALAVETDYSGRFLTPVLERVQAENRMSRSFRVTENSKNSALFPRSATVIGTVLRYPRGERGIQAFNFIIGWDLTHFGYA